MGNGFYELSARAPEALGRHYEIAYPGREWTSARGLKVPALHGRHAVAGAHFGQRFGWERALYFGAAGPPALRVAHLNAARFDQSSFGEIKVAGADSEKFLQRVCANDMTRAPGHAIDTAMLNARDLVALCLAENDFRLYVGTDAIRRDLSWLTRHRRAGERVVLSDETNDLALPGSPRRPPSWRG